MTRCGWQISDKERELEFTTLFKDVAGVIADKCINPDTQRPYTLSMVERALRDVHFSVDPKRGAKQQALQVRVTLLQPPLHACMPFTTLAVSSWMHCRRCARHWQCMCA